MTTPVTLTYIQSGKSARNRPVQCVAGPQRARERDQYQRHDDNGRIVWLNRMEK